MKHLVYSTIIASAMLAPAAAHAQTVVVSDDGGTATATTWGTLPGENSAGASTRITATAPQSGNGSLELRGDRTRFQLGNQFGGSSFATNLMPLSSVSGLKFDWRIAGDSISGYNPNYTPALRLLVQDGAQRSELIWEGANNGTYANTVRDTWYSSSFDDTFYQFKSGLGVTLNGGSQVNQTISSWIANNYSANAFVSGISVGDGSGALATYHAFTDNVSLRTTGGVTVYNFEVAAGAVPEPATWVMMFLGFGMVAGAARYRRRGAITAHG